MHDDIWFAQEKVIEKCHACHRGNKWWDGVLTEATPGLSLTFTPWCPFAHAAVPGARNETHLFHKMLGVTDLSRCIMIPSRAADHSLLPPTHPAVFWPWLQLTYWPFMRGHVKVHRWVKDAVWPITNEFRGKLWASAIFFLPQWVLVCVIALGHSSCVTLVKKL